MRIVKATLVKLKTDDGAIRMDAEIGREYLVDLNSIGSANPLFHGLPLTIGERQVIYTVCPDCRQHYVGAFPTELLRIEADA